MRGLVLLIAVMLIVESSFIVKFVVVKI